MRRSTRESVPPIRFVNEYHVIDTGSLSNEPPKPNMFSKLPLELREMVCRYLAQADLLNLTKTDKSSYEAANAQLYKTGTFHLRFGKGNQRRNLTPSPSWSAIQHLHFHISATEPKAKYRAQIRLTHYYGSKLAPIWNFGGSNPARALCQITLNMGRTLVRDLPKVFMSTIAMLSGFAKLVLKIEFFRTWFGWDDVKVLRVLEPLFGQGNTLDNHGRETLCIIFFPLRHQSEEAFDGSYERSMLAAWTATWNRSQV